MLLCSLELSSFKSKVDSDKFKCIWLKKMYMELQYNHEGNKINIAKNL